ncbi:hypothetical protein PRK78_003539 [Emydomyces testavorans]|uniref:Uncharacterized protein n=1 Tax=Emydomyces testavorans TaxID=2070801 RepID=A0AAF0DI99_9EURO|nr:hypothetical protein PRK78_003539 [Emydomyces testavorans]
MNKLLKWTTDTPTLACGWIEHSDRNLCLHPFVTLVVIPNFKPTPTEATTIRDPVEVGAFVDGQPVTQQQETIFPPPPARQHITIARRDLMGSPLPGGRSGIATFDTSIDRLGKIARTALALEGLSPA